METNKLSIIIITYNSQTYIENCIDSIIKNCDKLNYEIVICDNASTDQTINIIEEKYPEIKLIKSKNNLGFAKGNNHAINFSTGEYVLMLNHDTVLLNDISKAVELIKNNDEIGAVGIKMVDKNENYIASAGKFPTPTNLIKLSNLNYNSTEFISGKFNPDNFREVDWLTGAFLLTKRAYWDEVSGLDEQYFMYVEDVDFCKKLALKNKKTIFLPSLSYIHYVGFNKSREKYLIEGYKIYADKFFNSFDKSMAKVCLSINYGYKKAFKGFR